MTDTTRAVAPGLAPTACGLAWGYTRISTSHQTDAAQRQALLDLRVPEERIYSDVISGATRATERPGWTALFQRLRAGDQLVVQRLDRLGRSSLDVLANVAELTGRGIVLRSVHDGIDASTATGRLVLAILAGLAEWERTLIRERVTAGLTAARARGVRLGRPTLDIEDELAKARVLTDLIDQGRTVIEAGAILGWSRATSYRRLALLRDHSAQSTSRE